MAEATGSLSFWDLVIAVATRKYRGIQFVGDWPTETEIADILWAGHTTAEITLADRYLDDAKRIANAGYKRFLIAHDWDFLTTRTTLTGWVTATGAADGAPAYGDPESTVTAAAAMFYPSMVGQTLTFDVSGREFVIEAYTSALIVDVTGDASMEADEAVITVTATGYQRLPDDFGGEMIDERIYFAPDGLGDKIVEVPIGRIIDARAGSDLTAQYPWAYGLETVQVGGYTRWNVSFWPRWSANTTLHYRYRKQTCELTSADGVTDYPLGGAEFSTAIREACMMMVEEDRGYTKGPAHDSYNVTLAQAVQRDSRNKPRNRGQNRDNSDGFAYPRRHVFGSVTFDG